MNTPRFYDNLLSLVEGLDLVGDTTFVRHCKTALTDLLHTPEALRASHAVAVVALCGASTALDSARTITPWRTSPPATPAA